MNLCSGMGLLRESRLVAEIWVELAKPIVNRSHFELLTMNEPTIS